METVIPQHSSGLRRGGVQPELDDNPPVEDTHTLRNSRDGGEGATVCVKPEELSQSRAHDPSSQG